MNQTTWKEGVGNGIANSRLPPILKGLAGVYEEGEINCFYNVVSWPSGRNKGAAIGEKKSNGVFLYFHFYFVFLYFRENNVVWYQLKNRNGKGSTKSCLSEKSNIVLLYIFVCGSIREEMLSKASDSQLVSIETFSKVYFPWFSSFVLFSAFARKEKNYFSMLIYRITAHPYQNIHFDIPYVIVS